MGQAAASDARNAVASRATEVVLERSGLRGPQTQHGAANRASNGAGARRGAPNNVIEGLASQASRQVFQAAAGSDLSRQTFEVAAAALVPIAANGYPRALRSTLAIRNEMLRKHRGDPFAAVSEVMAQDENLVEEAKEFLLVLVPYVGIPAGAVYPLWKQLRRACLVAALFGHDLQDPGVQTRILYAVAGTRAGASLAKAGLQKAAEVLWQIFARKAGLSKVAKMVPVGKVLTAFAELEGKSNQCMVEEFEGGGADVAEAAYGAVLDAEPTSADFVDLLREVGEQSLGQVVARGLEVAQEIARRDQQGNLAGVVQLANDFAQQRREARRERRDKMWAQMLTR